ncbi:MAG TPA: hypothetical protein PKE59_00330 [Novosphingobium sp.]|jgi:hypothetical protein|nr:hypothetical protein [Novosphingobium sp.]
MPKINVELDRATERKLTERAKRQGCTVEELVEAAVETFLARHHSQST